MKTEKLINTMFDLGVRFQRDKQDLLERYKAKQDESNQKIAFYEKEILRLEGLNNKLKADIQSLEHKLTKEQK
jgi:predicted  nucleic acid-binding Zn-ribbon protein